MGQDGNFGLAAAGVSGEVTVEVLSRPVGGWLLSVQSPVWCVEIELATPGTVGELSHWLRSHVGRAVFAELPIGSLGGLAVRMVKDSEFEDRFSLRATGRSLVEFTLAGGMESDFARAVAEAATEFDSERDPPV